MIKYDWYNFCNTALQKSLEAFLEYLSILKKQMSFVYQLNIFNPLDGGARPITSRH
jgi:hypothetical protein